MGTTAQPWRPGPAPAAGSPRRRAARCSASAPRPQRAGVSERALRYYQQIGLIVPACTRPAACAGTPPRTWPGWPGSAELQTLLGLNLDEIAVVLRNEDRLAQIRLTYHDERTSDDGTPHG